MYLHKPGHISYDILSDMIYNSGLVIIKFSPLGEILYSNNYFEFIFGFKQDEIIGRNIAEILFNQKNNKLMSQQNVAESILSNPIYHQLENEHLTKNGGLLWFSWQIRPFYHPTSNLHMGFYCVGQEITHRKIIESRLVASEKKLNDFLNLLPELVFEIDASLQITFINQSCIDFIGYVNFLTSQNKVQLKDIIIPEDFVRLKSLLFINFNVTRDTGNTFGIIHKNGSLIKVQLHNNPIYDGNKIVGLRCIAINITEKDRYEKRLLEQEEKFRLIYENSPVPYQSLNEYGEIVEINPSWLKALGYNRKEVVGAHFSEFLPDDQKYLFAQRFEVFKENGEVKDVQFTLNCKDKSKLIVNYNGKIERSKSGEFIRSHCVFNDITLQLKAENTLIQSEHRLRELNATKDKFFSIIAHDLKNPFNDIIGFSYLLSTNIYKYDLQKVEQFANIIHQSSRLAFNLLENLLDWSRSQTGNLKFSPERFFINDLVLENLELVESTAENKSIKLFNEVDNSTYVFADKNMIRTVLRNLISNALKFTNQGGFVRITSSINRNFATLNVIDNGIGLNYEDQKKIFRIDTNITRQGTEKERGTGLGLILCKEFIERNGGKIDFESQPDKGSRYFFTLPVARDDNSSSDIDNIP